MVKKLKMNEAYTDDRVRRSAQKFVNAIPEGGLRSSDCQLYSTTIDIMYRLCRSIIKLVDSGNIDDYYEFLSQNYITGDINYVVDKASELAEVIETTLRNIKYINDKISSMSDDIYNVQRGIIKFHKK